ncbi:MAG: hypothetical protein FWE36_08080 [Erysipelotrichales bacterium]|nr:hypothetical protein [Erysipelotrichales bacterium]
MFLSLLNRKEKLKFLDLAIYMIDIDGEPNAVEKRLLQLMLAELGSIAGEYSFEKTLTVEETIDFFTCTNQVVKNIVFLNLVKITMTDDLYNTSEHLFLEAIQDKFFIDMEKRRELMSIIYAERDLRERARRAIEA